MLQKKSFDIYTLAEPFLKAKTTSLWAIRLYAKEKHFMSKEKEDISHILFRQNTSKILKKTSFILINSPLTYTYECAMWVGSELAVVTTSGCRSSSDVLLLSGGNSQFLVICLDHFLFQTFFLHLFKLLKILFLINSASISYNIWMTLTFVFTKFITVSRDLYF